MQKFIDRRGRVWIVDIDNTTLRRVKTLVDVRLLDAIDGDLINRSGDGSVVARRRSVRDLQTPSGPARR